MQKKSILTLALIILVASVAIDVLFGRFIAARISTLSFVRHWGLLSPQAPIVINTREQISQTASEDLQNGINKSKYKVAAVVLISGQLERETGNALTISEDGLFVSVKTAFPEQGGEYKLRLASGQSVAIEKFFSDPKSPLVFLKVTANGLSAASFQSAAELNIAQNIFSVRPGNLAFTPQVSTGIISRIQADIIKESLSSDSFLLSFGVSSLEDLEPGTSICNIQGDIIGIWDGSKIISSDTLKLLVSNYLTNKQQVIRPAYGFNYTYLYPYENSNISKDQLGIEIVKPEKGFGKASLVAGLQEGDIITKINNTSIDPKHLVEQQLMEVSPGTEVTLTVYRNNTSQNIKITPTKSE